MGLLDSGPAPADAKMLCLHPPIARQVPRVSPVPCQAGGLVTGRCQDGFPACRAYNRTFSRPLPGRREQEKKLFPPLPGRRERLSKTPLSNRMVGRNQCRLGGRSASSALLPVRADSPSGRHGRRLGTPTPEDARGGRLPGPCSARGLRRVIERTCSRRGRLRPIAFRGRSGRALNPLPIGDHPGHALGRVRDGKQRLGPARRLRDGSQTPGLTGR